LIDLGRVDEALAVMKGALRTDPAAKRDPFIHRALAKAHENKKALPMAAAALKRAIEIERSLPRTSVIILVTDYGQLARVYTVQGKTAEGRRTLETSWELLRKDQRLSEGIRAGVTAQILGNLALIDAIEAVDADYYRDFLTLTQAQVEKLAVSRPASPRRKPSPAWRNWCGIRWPSSASAWCASTSSAG